MRADSFRQPREFEQYSRHRDLSFYLQRTAPLAILLLIACAFLTRPDWYLEAPGPSYCVRGMFTVEGKTSRGTGCFYLVTVVTKRASWAQRAFPPLRNGDTLVSGDVLRRNQQVIKKGEESFWKASTNYSVEVAEAVALRNAKYRVFVRPEGVRVGAINRWSPAARTLDAFSDTIVEADGHPTLTTALLLAVIRRQRPGATVRLTVWRNGDQVEIPVLIYATRSSPSDAVGAYLEQTLVVEPPIRIDHKVRNLYGASAGLAFALELADRLGPKIDRGYQIAATGKLELDGRVEPIGGVKQKVRAAQRAGVEIFLVPAGENAVEARRNAGNLKIIPVTSFQQALRELAKLPWKPGSEK